MQHFIWKQGDINYTAIKHLLLLFVNIFNDICINNAHFNKCPTIKYIIYTFNISILINLFLKKSLFIQVIFLSNKH